MPEQEPEAAENRFAGELNGPQKRRLGVTCRYIDGLLCDMEHALDTAASESPFPRYVVDVTPAQRRGIEGHIRRLRTQLLRTLDWQRLKPDPAEIPVTRSITSDLAFVDIAIEELKPKYMRACGTLPDDAVGKLNEVIRELRFMVKEMESYIRHGSDTGSESTPEL